MGCCQTKNQEERKNELFDADAEAIKLNNNNMPISKHNKENPKISSESNYFTEYTTRVKCENPISQINTQIYEETQDNNNPNSLITNSKISLKQKEQFNPFFSSKSKVSFTKAVVPKEYEYEENINKQQERNLNSAIDKSDFLRKDLENRSSNVDNLDNIENSKLSYHDQQDINGKSNEERIAFSLSPDLKKKNSNQLKKSPDRTSHVHSSNRGDKEAISKNKDLDMEEDSNLSFNSDPKNNFDCYEHSKEIFNFINDIRLNPGVCIDLIEEIITKVQTDGNVDFIEIETLPYLGGGFLKGKYQLKNGKKGLKDLLSFLLSNKDKVYEPVLWSEKAYSKCELGIINLNGLNIHYSDDEENNTEKFEKQNENNKHKNDFKSQVQGILEGSFSASITAILLLSEEISHIREAFIVENFDTGACCYTNSEEDYPKGISMLIFGIKKQREERLLEMPSINTNELDLDDPVFDYIKYKNNIVSGEFTVENGLLTATFTLDDNSTKIERIVI
jgi:hypothetical protein